MSSVHIKPENRKSGRAFIYNRRSSELQKGNTSFERQTDFAQDICNELGLEVVDVVRDDGKSARHGKNLTEGNFAIFYDVAEEGDYLIVEEWSRLSRAGFWDTTDAIRPLINKGVNLVVGKDEDGELIIINKSNVDKISTINRMANSATGANRENERRIVKISEAYRINKGKIKNGNYAPMNCLPPWLKNPRQPNGRCVREDGEYIFDEEGKKKASIVAYIFNLFVNNKWNVNQIVKHLNSNLDKYPLVARRKPDPSLRWTTFAIRRLLVNKAVIGIYEQRATNEPGWEKKDVFPVIVDKDLFWQAVKILTDKRKGHYRGRKSETRINLFKGILQCKCGGFMSCHCNVGKGAETRKLSSDSHKYYICNRSVAGGGCPKFGYRSLPMTKVEYAFQQILARADIVKGVVEKEKNELPSAIPALEAERETVRKERRNSVNMGKRLEVQPDELIETIETLTRRELQLTREIENERVRLEGNRPLKDALKTYQERFHDAWKNPHKRLELQQLLREIIGKTEVDTKEKTIEIWFTNAPQSSILVKLMPDHCEINGLSFQYETP